MRKGTATGKREAVAQHSGLTAEQIHVQQPTANVSPTPQHAGSAIDSNSFRQGGIDTEQRNLMSRLDHDNSRDNFVVPDDDQYSEEYKAQPNERLGGTAARVPFF